MLTFRFYSDFLATILQSFGFSSTFVVASTRTNRTFAALGAHESFPRVGVVRKPTSAFFRGFVSFHGRNWKKIIKNAKCAQNRRRFHDKMRKSLFWDEMKKILKIFRSINCLFLYFIRKFDRGKQVLPWRLLRQNLMNKVHSSICSSVCSSKLTKLFNFGELKE